MALISIAYCNEDKVLEANPMIAGPETLPRFTNIDSWAMADPASTPGILPAVTKILGTSVDKPIPIKAMPELNIFIGEKKNN